VDPRAGLDTVGEEKKFPAPAGIRTPNTLYYNVTKHHEVVVRILLRIWEGY